MKTIAFAACVFALLASGCSTPPAVQRPDPEIDRNAVAGNSAYAAGSVKSAREFYLKALNRARLTDQPREIARMAYNLAACLAQQQKYDEALKLLDEARFASDQAGMDFCETALLKTEILYRRGQTNEALALAQSEMNQIKQAGQEKNNSCFFQFQLFLAETACDRNDGALALKELDKADKHMPAASAPLLQAKAAEARARALLLENKFAEAAAWFDRAAAFNQKAGRYLEMALALQRAGGSYQAANDRRAAFNRYSRSARTLFLAGESEKAHESFAKASKLAQDQDEKEMLDMLARLKPESISPSGNASGVTNAPAK